MALTVIKRGEIQDGDLDYRRFVIVAVSESSDDAPSLGTTYTASSASYDSASFDSTLDSAFSAPIDARVSSVRVQKNWLPGVYRYTITYTAARGA